MDGEEAHVSFVTSSRILHSVQAPSFPVQVLESSHHIPCCLGCRSGLIFVSLTTSKRGSSVITVTWLFRVSLYGNRIYCSASAVP